MCDSKVSHKTTLRFLSNLRNLWQKLIWKHRRLGVQATAKMANFDRMCVMHFNRWIEHGKGLCKNGSKSAMGWRKRTSRGNLFWTFATHTEWTRFVEVRNYLWWDLDIYVWPRNKTTFSALEVTKLSKRKKKVTWDIQSSRPCCLFSLVSRLLWWQSGFPVAGLSISTVILKSWLNCMNMWEGNGQDFGEMGGFCCRTMCHPITLCLYSSFEPVKMSVCLLILPHVPVLASRNFFLFPKIKSMLEGTHFVLAEEVKAKTAEVLNIHTGNDPHHCFCQW